MVVTSETCVRDIVTQCPTAIPVLERLGIDYCCNGQHSLGEACTKRNLELEPVLKELGGCWQHSAVPVESEWMQAPLKKLADYIVQKHHVFTRQQLDLIDNLMGKVEQSHGATHPEVFKLGKTLAILGSEMRHHTECEETNLFPYIAAMGTDNRPDLPAPAKGSLQMPITHMMTDHAQTGEELEEVRALTNNYTPPSDACTTWRALYRAIEDLEADLHQHIHLENNILFPRALKQQELETQKLSGSSKVTSPVAEVATV